MSFGGSSPKVIPAVETPPPDIDDPAIEEAKRRERERLRRRRGARASILTGPEGATEEANVGRKTLLGE